MLKRNTKWFLCAVGLVLLSVWVVSAQATPKFIRTNTSANIAANATSQEIVSTAPTGNIDSTTAPLRVTATAHSIVFSWTAFTSSITGLTVAVSCGATAGSENASTPVISGLAPSAATGTWTAPTAGATYYCEAFSTAPNPSGGTVTSGPSNEVSVKVPLVQGDLPVPGGLVGSGN